MNLKRWGLLVGIVERSCVSITFCTSRFLLVYLPTQEVLCCPQIEVGAQ